MNQKIIIKRSETERDAVCNEEGGCACGIAFVPCRYVYFNPYTKENFSWPPDDYEVVN